MPNIALQRTPLARPLTWARLFGVVAHRRSCRSVEVASGAAESWRWAALNPKSSCQAAKCQRWVALIICGFIKNLLQSRLDIHRFFYL